MQKYTSAIGSAIKISNLSCKYFNKKSIFTRRADPIALKKVSLEIKRGSVTGIIGGNGSGKSTLLKLIAGVITPNTGVIENNAKNPIMLSLHLGFSGELSGRENAIISLLMYGCKRQHILLKLDAIQNFSELGRTFDEPVKTYSTGMRARLGFSIATEIETDLIILDEVMSVGDLTFRKKAKSYIMTSMLDGKTVIIASHNLNFMKDTCDYIFWLNNGLIECEGPPKFVIDKYKKFTVSSK